MKTLGLKIGLFISLFLVVSFSAAGQEALKQPVVKITAINEFGQEEDGTGVIIGQKGDDIFITTAAHVIPLPDNIQVRFLDGDPLPGTVVQTNTGLDLAVIKCRVPEQLSITSSFALAKTEEKSLQSIIVIGHPSGNNWDINYNSNVKTTEYDLDDRLFTLAPIGITPGNSGGPVLNQQYELLGLVQRVDPVKAVCVDVATLVKACQAWGVPTNLMTGVSVENQPAAAGKEDFRYQLFLQEANTAFSAGKWVAAKRAFEQLNRLSPTETTQRKIEQCELEMATDELYEQYFAKAENAGTLEASLGFFVQARKQRDTPEVRERIDLIKERLAQMEVKVSDGLSAKDAVERYTDPLAGEMVFVEGGSFMMGNGKEGFLDNEFPPHRVLLSDYYIGAKEITRGQFHAFLEDISNRTPYVDYGEIKVARKYKGKTIVGYQPQLDATYKDHPVQVSWGKAYAFCKWLSEKTGFDYRLPTEAEWEYAAKGGNKATETLYAGSNDFEEVSWNIYSDYNYVGGDRNGPQKTGLKKPNELGLYDMTGNVSEWCQDIYKADYYQDCEKKGVVTDPTGPDSDEKYPDRVNRGGSYMSYTSKNGQRCQNGCLSITRRFESDRFNFKYNTTGFRVVRSAYKRYQFKDPFDSLLVYIPGKTSLGQSSAKNPEQISQKGFYVVPFAVDPDYKEHREMLREIIGGHFGLVYLGSVSYERFSNGSHSNQNSEENKEEIVRLLREKSGKDYRLMSDEEIEAVPQAVWKNIDRVYRSYGPNKSALFIKLVSPFAPPAQK